MKKREDVLYVIIVTIILVVFISCLVNEIVYHICALRNQEYETSWRVLRVVQVIALPPTFALLLVFLYYKFRRLVPLHSLNQKRKKRIKLMIKIYVLSFFVLFFAAGIPLVIYGNTFELYRLARAHGTLLIVLCFVLGRVVDSFFV